MNWLTGMVHNTMLLCKAERLINTLLENGMSIYIRNPDGTQVKLKAGMQMFSLEVSECGGMINDR